MNTSASGALIVELHPVSAAQWVATYYPLVATSAGRWAEVTWALHECLLPIPPVPLEAARWLEVRSPDPGHPCYTGHRAWRAPLAAGYTQALAVYEAEAINTPSSPQDPEQLKEATVVVTAGQLSEWVLDDLEDEISNLHG